MPSTMAVDTLRTNWIRIKLTPQVANNVSRGLPYNRLIKVRSSNTPTSAVTKNDSTKATGK